MSQVFSAVRLVCVNELWIQLETTTTMSPQIFSYNSLEVIVPRQARNGPDVGGRANRAGDNWNYLNYPIEMITTGIANYP